MKKILLYVMLFVSACASAQDLSNIKQSYYDIKQKIKMQQEVPEMQNNCAIILNHNVPGIGVQKVRYNMFFTPSGFDSEGLAIKPVLEFASCSYNVAALKFYEEYLFDKSGNLIFVYYKYDDYDLSDGYVEKRVYYNCDGSLIHVKVNNFSEGHDKIVYEGRGNDYDSANLSDIYNFAKNIVAMYNSINNCIKK